NLSLQIQQLEEELGTRLFERVGRAVRLTAEGKLFLEYAQRALDEVEAGQQGIHDLKRVTAGSLRIGLTNSFNTALFPRLLAEFVRVQPSIRISVSLEANHCIEDGVRNAELDLGLVSQSSRNPEFRRLQLFRQELLVVVSRR